MDAVKPGTMTAERALAARPERSADAEIDAIVERAKQGDPAAFDRLMRLYEGRVIALGLHMGLSRDDALDACQEAFLKVFRYIHRFRSGEVFFRWLYRIALHAVYDQLSRRRGTENSVSLDAIEAAEIPDGAVTPEARAQSRDLRAKLIAELGCLTRQERIVFVLRDLQQVSTLEIGRVMRLSQVTIRRHCTSARQKLRIRLFPPQA